MRRSRCVFLLIALASAEAGCITDKELLLASDLDGDGYYPLELGGDDCDNADAAINPGADELCGDQKDNNCDGLVDDAGAGEILWYLDNDLDDIGQKNKAVNACEQPDGYVSLSGDCDDDDASVSPNAEEVACNGVDDDCDTETDEVAGPDWYRDSDGDGFGDDAEILTSCDPGTGWSEVGGDCDDSDASVYPDAADDQCDGVDNNCSGVADSNSEFTVYFFDTDGDGYGAADAYTSTCDGEPKGYVSKGTDCDDALASVYPGAPEVCDWIDNDCDKIIDDADEDVVEQPTWYLDTDEDGEGDPKKTFLSCVQPKGYVASAGDCDDSDSLNFTGNTEVCDAQDNDCDSLTDEDDPSLDLATATLFFADSDGDGYGQDGTGDYYCYQPSLTAKVDGDCDDLLPNVNPGEHEQCSTAYDDDCNGLVNDEDAGVLGQLMWYPDSDVDGYGDDGSVGHYSPESACIAPSGYVGNEEDCDDSNDSISPDGTEVCDLSGTDEDCDGLVNDADGSLDMGTTTVWHLDLDGDTYGDIEDVGVGMCDGSPLGLVEDQSDCDDDEVNANPGLFETCGDWIDNDCDSTTDCRLQGVIGAQASADGVIEGVNTSDGACGVKGVGDLNSDGVDDIAISTLGDSASAGTVSLFFSPPTLATPVDADFIVNGTSFGSGDISGDGVPEFFAAFTNDRGLMGIDGEVYAYQQPLVESPWLSVSTEMTESVEFYLDLGYTLDASGDIDGDAVSDLIVSALEYNDQGGAIYIFTGATPGDFSQEDAFVQILGEQSLARFGDKLSAEIDANGDGLFELLATEPAYEDFGFDDGRMTLFEGGLMSGAITSDDYDSVLSNFWDNDWVGTSLDSAGDINGDGTPEWIVGSLCTSACDDAAFVVSMGAAGLLQIDASYSSISNGDHSGYSAAGIGDIDGDGFDDIAISAPEYDVGGGVVIFYGSEEAFGLFSMASADAILAIEELDAVFGYGVDGVGDVNADGFDDFMVSAAEADKSDGTVDVGVTYLFYGIGI